MLQIFWEGLLAHLSTVLSRLLVFPTICTRKECLQTILQRKIISSVHPRSPEDPAERGGGQKDNSPPHASQQGGPHHSRQWMRTKFCGKLLSDFLFLHQTKASPDTNSHGKRLSQYDVPARNNISRMCRRQRKRNCLQLPGHSNLRQIHQEPHLSTHPRQARA